MARLTFHGHSCFELATDTGPVLLFDPFLDDNPIADVKAADIEAVDFILCSHGHYDHFPDGVTIAKRTGATMIGDNFTMGPQDAARAVEFIAPRVVIPMHYNTWPQIAQDPTAFARRVGDLAEVVVLEPGESYEF